MAPSNSRDGIVKAESDVVEGTTIASPVGVAIVHSCAKIQLDWINPSFEQGQLLEYFVRNCRNHRELLWSWFLGCCRFLLLAVLLVVVVVVVVLEGVRFVWMRAFLLAADTEVE